MTSGIGGQAKAVSGRLTYNTIQYNIILGMPEHTRLEVIFKDLGRYSGGGMCAPYYFALSPDLPIFYVGMLSLWCSGLL